MTTNFNQQNFFKHRENNVNTDYSESKGNTAVKRRKIILFFCLNKLCGAEIEKN